MAKRFMYVSIGVLCLVAAYQLGVERAQADWDPSVSGEIVGGWNLVWFTRSGEAWYAQEATGWTRAPVYDMPVPVGQVKFLEDGWLITIDDVAHVNVGGGWIEIGPFPGGPVALEQESWGRVKAKHR